MVSVAGVTVVGQLVASGLPPPRVEPFFLHAHAHLGTANSHTHTMDGHLGMIAAPLYHTGSGCWGQESQVSVKGNWPFSPSYSGAKVWRWMSDSGFLGGVVLFYLREVKAWKSLARLMSE